MIKAPFCPLSFAIVFSLLPEIIVAPNDTRFRH
jgi:hypothetical protein